MPLLQKLVRHVIHPLSLWRAGDAAQLEHLREFERTQYLTADALRQLQWQRLQSLLEHAYRQCPFYRERFEKAGLAPGNIKTLDDLRVLPVLEKQDIQEQRDRMVAGNWPRQDLVPNYTGGSTGRPLSFYLSGDRLRSRAAATVRHNRWAGWDIGDKAGVIWGAPRDRPVGGWRSRLRNLFLERQLFLDTGHLTEAKMAAFSAELHRFCPKVILAYARSATLFARYLKQLQETPYRPHAIVTSAEVLEREDRELLEEVFGCPVFNRYGCREVSVIASECAAHRGLHVMAEGLYVEIVRGAEPAPAGEMGTILVTDLLNRAMPLIRYRIGDLGAWEEGPCSCGRGLPRLKNVAGRVTDFVVGGDGRLVSGAFLSAYVVGQRPTLGQVQIRQEEAGKVLYRIQRGRNFKAEEELAYLGTSTRKYLGENTAIAWEFVDELKPEPSGKFLFCRSTVAADFLKPASAVLGKRHDHERAVTGIPLHGPERAKHDSPGQRPGKGTFNEFYPERA